MQVAWVASHKQGQGADDAIIQHLASTLVVAGKELEGAERELHQLRWQHQQQAGEGCCSACLGQKWRCTGVQGQLWWAACPR